MTSSSRDVTLTIVSKYQVAYVSSSAINERSASASSRGANPLEISAASGRDAAQP